MDILRNIFSFCGTFLVICSSIIIVAQMIVCAYTGKWGMKDNTDYRIVIIGIVVALLLIPFYYLPA